jgi:hypothetical protein
VLDPNAPGPPPNTLPGGQTIPPPDWLVPILSQYGSTGYQYTPEDLQAIANWAQQMQMQTSVGQLQYQQDYLAEKSKELDLSAQQQDQMAKEFAFQSGPYWDWFKNDAFQFEKDKLGMERQLSADQLTMSGNQVAMSANDLVRSANQTLATQWQTDAAKAQAQATQWQAMQAMGLGGQPPSAWKVNF